MRREKQGIAWPDKFLYSHLKGLYRICERLNDQLYLMRSKNYG